jgi:hypothetical protein
MSVHFSGGFLNINKRKVIRIQINEPRCLNNKGKSRAILSLRTEPNPNFFNTLTILVLKTQTAAFNHLQNPLVSRVNGGVE